jgi:hypothetical protein
VQSETPHSPIAKIEISMKTILKEVRSEGYPLTAICVQRFDDSLNSAIRITYRVSLRSSSIREPRDPLLRVVQSFIRNMIGFILVFLRLGRKHMHQTNVIKKGLNKMFLSL